MWCLIVAAVVVVGVLAWIFVAQNGSRKADELIAKAYAATADSVARASILPRRRRRRLQERQPRKGRTRHSTIRKATTRRPLTYLNDCSLNDDIAEAGVETLRGDCYVNLEKYAEALDCYDDAIDAADENPQIVPLRAHKDGTHLPSAGRLRLGEKGLQDHPRRLSHLRQRHLAPTSAATTSAQKPSSRITFDILTNRPMSGPAAM